MSKEVESFNQKSSVLIMIEWSKNGLNKPKFNRIKLVRLPSGPLSYGKNIKKWLKYKAFLIEVIKMMDINWTSSGQLKCENSKIYLYNVDFKERKVSIFSLKAMHFAWSFFIVKKRHIST